jgi:DNA-binding IclR family transcriptional regulator
VFGPGSQAIAAVSVTGTTPRQINAQRIPSLAKIVVKYAELMSSRLGGKL